MMGGRPYGYSLEIVDILVINVRISSSSLVTVGVHSHGINRNFASKFLDFRGFKSRVFLD